MNRLIAISVFVFTVPCTVGTSLAVDPASTTSVCTELAVTPEFVVVAGLHGQVRAMLQRLEDAAIPRQELGGLHDQEGPCSRIVRSCAADLRAAGEDEHLVTQYRSAVHDLAVVQQEISRFRDALFAEAVRGVPEGEIASLQRCRRGASYEVSMEFLVLELPAREWRRVQAALRAERGALRRGETLAPEYARLLEDLRRHVDVRAAMARLEAQLPAVRQVFADFADGGN